MRKFAWWIFVENQYVIFYAISVVLGGAGQYESAQIAALLATIDLIRVLASK